MIDDRNIAYWADMFPDIKKDIEELTDKYHKEQAKNKALRAKNIAQYKATGGVSGWDASYTVLKTLTESSER